MDKQALIDELKALIIEECDKEDEFEVDDIDPTMALFGSDSELDLDSLDSLQISMAVKKRYGVRIEGQKEARMAMASVEALANYIIEHK